MVLNMTVGMATYDDFYGVNMTVQSLMMHHMASGYVTEIIVVDNNPDSEQGDLTAKYCKGLGSAVKYVPMYGVRGTAQPRNEVFRQASNPYVVCCDPHVLFPVSSLLSLARFYEKNPNIKDLIQGPIMWDDLKSGATHFRIDDDAWGAEMWGKWDMAYVNPFRNRSRPSEDSPKEMIAETYRIRPINGKNCVVSTMDGDRIIVDQPGITTAEMHNMGFVEALHSHGAVFEIPAMGLGVFSCRKDAWLEFNPKFYGFGGEEGYIHIKYRKAGRKVLCLTGFQWWHRFQRLRGTPYPNVIEEKARNYVIGFRELGLPLDPIYRHFVQGVYNQGGRPPISEERWKLVLEEKILNLNEEQKAKAPARSVEAKKECKTCGKRSETKPASCSSCSQSTWSIAQWYEWAAGTPSDINEHAPVLKEYASKSKRVIEFGVRTGVSTAALLDGNPEQLISYDLNESSQARMMAAQANREKKDFQFFIGNSLYIEPEECDLLFIDTVHTGEHCLKELRRHGPKVKKWIILHDTEIFGNKGEDGSDGGLMFAIRTFLATYPEWSTVKHFRNNHGLTVLSRVPEEQPPKLPSTLRMAATLAKSTLKDLANGSIRVPLEVAKARHAICTSNNGTCPLNLRRIDDDRCAGCGCYLWEQKGQPEGSMTGKVWRPLDACPHSLWGNHIPEEMQEEGAE